MKIQDYDQSDEKPQIVLIDMWYDRHSRNWVIQQKDSNGYQIGVADYVYTKHEAQTIKNRYEQQFQIGISISLANKAIGVK